jgi:carboxymethylenebutenolidase
LYLRMDEALRADTIRIPGAGGDEIEAYLARPLFDRRRGSVVVIHHLPGYDRATKEMTRRFAAMGYDALCPNLFWREAPGAEPDDASAVVRAAGGVPDERLVGDVAAAADHLRELPSANRRIGVIGHCSGGRQAVLAACHLPVDAVVDCYGAFVTGDPPPNWPLRVTNLVPILPNLSAPVLGLFGNEDRTPSPEHVDEFEAVLKANGKESEFYRYTSAGHGFFAVDRTSYRVIAAVDGWERIASFFARHLARAD